MLAAAITRLVGWAVALFLDVERDGPEIAGGPLLVAANHPNALVDPLVIFHTAGRVTRPLAKAPLFEQALVGTVLKGLGGLPVYRKQDDPTQMHRNQRTFEAAIEALTEGGAVQIYPEGQSHSEPSLGPLRTGAARIALRAESESGWRLGLRIQPVGLTYRRKHLFRGSVVATYGDSFPVSDFRARFEHDERACVEELTEEIARRLRRLTLNFETEEEAELVDAAERLYARAKGLVRPREREPLAARIPRLQRFADGLRRLRADDPARLARLGADVSRYMRLLTLYGASAGDVPDRYRLGSVLRYTAWQAFMLAVVLPAALVGMAYWFLPGLATRLIAGRFRPKLDQIATYKVGVAIGAFPLWLAATCMAVWAAAGVGWAVAVGVVLPVSGVAAIAWRERQAVVREDVRVFLRSRRRSERRDRLAELRTEIVAEIDRIADLQRPDRA